MSNANRDYAIIYDIKNSSLVLSRPLVFYITDKNTSNIFIRLVTRINIGDGIDQYTDIENASGYSLTMRVIKPNNEVKSIIATQHEPESIFQFDLTEDFKDIPGKYICELTISTIVSERQELITSDPFNYEVKRSILSNVSEVIETEDTTVEKLLNNLEASKIRLFNDLELAKTNLHNDLNATSSALNSQVQASNDKIENIKEELSSRLDITGAELSSQIKEIDTQTQKITNNNIKFKENFLLKRNPYGTYENASSFSVVTNSDYRPQVLGISPENDKTLATYNNRDMVGIYNSISTNKDNILVYENCNFTQNTVTIPLSYNLDNVLEGMIIDTLHSPKFSAIIREINKDTNVITVYNWYQMGNEDLGQIPSNGVGIKINNITKIWNINTNLYLKENDFDTAACGYEMDILNYQPHVDNVDGFDVILAGTYGGNAGCKIRGQGDLKWLYGIYAENCETGYYLNKSSIGYRSINSTMYSFLSNESDISFCSKGTGVQIALQGEADGKLFTIRNDGSMNALGFDYAVGKSDAIINPFNTPVCIMSGNIQLVAPDKCPKKYFIAHNISTDYSSITAIMQKGNEGVTGISIPPGKSVHMYCDGSVYYVLDFNL